MENYKTHKDIADFPDPAHWLNVQQRASDALKAIEAVKWPAIMTVSFTIANYSAVNIINSAYGEKTVVIYQEDAPRASAKVRVIGAECTVADMKGMVVYP